MNPLATLLKKDTEAICYSHGRMVGSPGHELARQHLKQRLIEIGCVPFKGDSLELPYTWQKLEFCNLVGRIPGQRSDLAPILIGAHYDSVIPYPCADDNAAAVAIALQTGSLLAKQGNLGRDLLIALFDAEEPPYFHTEAMGSERFYQDHLSGPNDIHAALVMDLVGHDVSIPISLLAHVPGIGGLLGRISSMGGADMSLPLFHSTLFVTGAESHFELVETLQTLGQPPGLKVVATRNDYIGDMSDHGVFRRHGVPYYFLSCGQWRHYHTPTDTPDRLNYDKMACITNYVASLVAKLTCRELGNRSGQEQIVETLLLEEAFLQKALGLLYRPVLKALGIKDFKSRPNMNRFVSFLLSSGLCH